MKAKETASDEAHKVHWGVHSTCSQKLTLKMQCNVMPPSQSSISYHLLEETLSRLFLLQAMSLLQNSPLHAGNLLVSANLSSPCLLQFVQ